MEFDHGRVEARSVAFTDVDASTDGSTFTGYAAVFDHEADLGDFTESISRGAFRKAIGASGNIPMLYDHNPGLPVLATTGAGTLKLKEDGRGLRVEANVARHFIGDAVREMVSRGDIRGMSFGLSPAPGTPRSKTGAASRTAASPASNDCWTCRRRGTPRTPAPARSSGRSAPYRLPRTSSRRSNSSRVRFHRLRTGRKLDRPPNRASPRQSRTLTATSATSPSGTASTRAVRPSSTPGQIGRPPLQQGVAACRSSDSRLRTHTRRKDACHATGRCPTSR
jgi:HK97 family phage prohead protease